MGASIILNSRYFRVAQPGQQENKNIFTKSHTANLVEYVGTRESVSFNNNNPIIEGNATDKQKNALEILMKECRDYKNTHEYIDYIENPTKANASELITRLSELLLLDNGILLDEGVSELVSYVGTRPSVDIEKSQQHGLFSSTENVNLEKAMEEISNHKGRIWTHVISLRREDADRLGYSSQAPWKQLVRSQIDTIAKANNIKLENLRWYAGMHNTGYHPHIHLFIYSTDPKEGYINAKGIKSIKSAFANEIFKDDLRHSFVSQTEYRNKIKEEMERLVDKINDNPLSQYNKEIMLELQGRLIDLAKAMPTTGKYFYKYQPQDIKNQVDNILHDLIEKSADMTKLYNMWCSEQEKILGTYNKHPKYNTPIENNNNFKMLKNCLLKKARELQIDNNLYLHNTGNTIENFAFNEPLIENESVPVDERDTKVGDEKQIEQFIDDNLDVSIDNIVEFEKENLLMPDFLTVNDEILDLEYKAEDNSDSAYNLGIKYLYGSTEDNIAKNYELAHRYLVMSANKNNAYANYQLGKMYYNGIGVEADIEISNNYFLKAHDLLLCQLPPETWDCINCNNPINDVNYDISRVMYTLGSMYYNGYGIMQNYEKAKLYFTGSQGKIPYSNIYLGNIALYGLGCDVNYSEAKSRYENAQKSKNELTQAQSSYKIAMIYEKGLGTNVDYRLAFQHYMISADMGFADAYYKMGQLLETEKFHTKDINKEDAYSCYKSAFDLYIKAEKEMPNKTTELTIGTMYTKGQGVETNEDKAIEWLTKSAQKGNATAYQKLGLIFANNDSKYFNVEKAIEYFEKSVDGGNSFANYQLAKIYLDKESRFYDLGKAITNLQTSADQGNHFANYHLGKIYADPESQYYNLDKAITNLQTSADQGNHFAN
ncbi:MAG: MobP3 family relaxase, partial [Acutalibacteraceae bacterium]